MRFKQSNFLKEYIDFCTAKRIASKTPFAKRLYKLFVNAVYGKFIEQVRGYLECKICTTAEAAKKAITNIRFQSMKIVSKNLVIVFLKPEKLVFNKAYPIGFSILELSKLFMFSEYYGRIKPRLKNCEILFSDTDSLALAVFSKKKISNLKKLDDIMDYSNYPPTHPKYDTTNANALGFWKDELQGNTFSEYVGLRSKCYAMQIESKNDVLHESKTNSKYLKSTCKGVRKGYKKTIPFSKFRRCVQTIEQHNVTQYNIQSRMHVVNTVKLRKICFGSFDDKRYLFQCGLHSVPYGSCYIKDAERDEICPFCT